VELVATPPSERRSFLGRIIGAALLQSEVYDELKQDPNATYQGAVVVLLAAFARVANQIVDKPIWVVAVPLVLLMWPVSVTFYFLCAKYLLTPQTTWGMADWLLRTYAFASAPQILLFLTPFIALWQGALIALGVLFWQLGTTIMAVRQGLQISTGRAIWVWFGTGLILGVIGGVSLFAAVVVVISAWT
jgi:hypothetical protein